MILLTSKYLHKYLDNHNKEMLKKLESESYKKENQFLHKIINISSLVVGIASILVTVSSIVSIVTIYKYDDKIQELQDNSNSTKYMIMAERSASFSEKVNNYTLAINYDNKNPFLYFSRAEAYYADNMYDTALKDCNYTLKIDDNYEDALFLRGKIYFEKELYSLSADDYNKYISLESNNNDVYTYLGYAYYFMEDFNTATQYFNNIVDMPMFPECFNGDYEKEAIISDCYLKVKEYSKARFFLQPLITQRCSRRKIEFITNKLIEIYKEEGDLQSVTKLKDMLVKMDIQYENIKNMTNNTVNIQGIETYQILYHELEVCTDVFFE